VSFEAELGPRGAVELGGPSYRHQRGGEGFGGWRFEGR
jgi:hypothetical protein